MRFLFKKINPDVGLTGIIGSSAAGRTGLLQQLMKSAARDERKVLYLDLSDPFFTVSCLSGIAQEFYRRGGETLFADNIQRYSNAGIDLVEIRKKLPQLRIVYTCGFLPEDEQGHKLRKNSVIHHLPGLSYREFIEYRYKFSFPVIQLDELLELNRNPGAAVLNRIRPLEHFNEYLEQGNYSIESDSAGDYRGKLLSVINTVIDSDLSAAFKLDNVSTIKIRRLLMKLAGGGMYRPNIEKLAREIGTTRDSLLKFIEYAGRAGLIRIYYKNNSKKSGKPQMLVLDNPNLVNSLSVDRAKEEQLYEAFLVNQLSYGHDISMPGEDRLIIDGEYSFQMSWKAYRAGRKDPPPDYVIDPDLEHQSGSRLPLWMFGFLY